LSIIIIKDNDIPRNIKDETNTKLLELMLDDNANVLNPNNLPNDNLPNKEWLDIATKAKDGPSEELMNQGKDDPNDKNDNNDKNDKNDNYKCCSFVLFT